MRKIEQRRVISVGSMSGFYHNPPVWVGDSPISKDQVDIDLESLGDQVFEGKIANIPIAVSRDGLFKFDFESFAPSAPDPSVDFEFNVIADLVIRRARVMNAFLACLYTSILDTRDAVTPDRMVVTPDQVLSVGTAKERESIGSGNLAIMNLYAARFESTYSPFFPKVMDQRVFPRTVVPVSAVATACIETSSLMGGHIDGVALADLFLRASKAFQEHNYSLALINSWTLVEGMLSVLWSNYLSDNRTRDGASFINKKRMDRLEDTGTYTASVMCEILSFVNKIPFSMYVQMEEVRRARNAWIHNMTPVGSEKASTALSLCSDMFALVHGFHLNGAAPLRINY